MIKQADVLTCLVCGAYIALTPSIVTADNHESFEMTPALEQLIRRDENPVPVLISQLFRIAADGKLTGQKLQDAVEFQQASKRSQTLQQVLYFDLNGDLQIDSAEVERSRRHLAGQTLERFEMIFSSADLDRDGAVSLDEMKEVAASESSGITVKTIDPYNLMQMDVDGDGVVTVTDITAMVERLKDYLPPQSQRQGQFQPARQEFPCELPKPSEEAALLFLSAYEGTSVSTTFVVGMDDATDVISVVVEEGDQPLFVVSTTFTPMILVFHGATERIEHYVGSYHHGGIGVVGLAAEKVTLQPNADCVPRYFTSVDSAEARVAVASLERTMGTSVDQVIAKYGIGQAQIPSGAISDLTSPVSRDVETGRNHVIRQRVTEDGIEALPTQIVTGPAQRTAENLMRFNRSGITKVPAELVIASSKAEAYDVLPQEAGLLQLIESGGLVALGGGRGYRIVEEIPRFPAQLGGAHLATFYLAEGVPIPQGSPGHSSVVSEETDECVLFSAICRR